MIPRSSAALGDSFAAQLDDYFEKYAQTHRNFRNPYSNTYIQVNGNPGKDKKTLLREGELKRILDDFFEKQGVKLEKTIIKLEKTIIKLDIFVKN